ncbi:hypothetical protein ACOMHN_053549 [Nucella lapillus]
MEALVRKALFLRPLLALCVSVPPSAGYSVLLVPIPVGSSHCLEMMGIGRALQDRGHTVHLLVPDFAEVNNCVGPDLRAAINVVTFPVDLEEAKWFISFIKTQFTTMASGEGGSLHLFQTLRVAIPRLCHMYAASRPLLDQFMTNKQGSTKKLDMVLLDGLPLCGCLTLIPAYLHTPFALVSSYVSPYDSNMPWPAISYPHPLTPLPGRMNFGQRVLNTVAFSASELMAWAISSLYDQGNDFGEDLADFDPEAAMKRADLYLENSDYILDYAKATYPNFVQVGGLTTGSARPMPEDLQKYFDSSTQGVVVVSLGSMLYNASQSITDKLLSAATKVKMNVVLRLNVKEATVQVPKHVKIVSWFPQNDALGHVNTRLFVSHCGKNGFYEGLYHGVPILCVPLNGDGIGTGQRVTDFGAGGAVDLKTISAEELGQQINSLTEDGAVRERMRFYSTLFHARPETPGQRAVSALEHVIQHGGHHLRPQTVELTFVQYTGLDVFFLLILAFLGLLATTLWVWGSILRWFIRRHGLEQKAWHPQHGLEQKAWHPQHGLEQKAWHPQHGLEQKAWHPQHGLEQKAWHPQHGLEQKAWHPQHGLEQKAWHPQHGLSLSVQSQL